MGTESMARLIEAVARALPVLVDAAVKDVMLLAVAVVVVVVVVAAGTQPAAGQAVEGLKCSLTLKPAAVKVGDEITIEADFRNVSDKPLSFHYPPETGARLAEEMIGLLKRDKDHTVRSRAAQALEHASGEKVVAALLAALKDENAFVGSYAAHSRARIGGPEAIPALEQYVRDAPKDSQKDAGRGAIEAIRARLKAALPAVRETSPQAPGGPEVPI